MVKYFCDICGMHIETGNNCRKEIDIVIPTFEALKKGIKPPLAMLPGKVTYSVNLEDVCTDCRISLAKQIALWFKFRKELKGNVP